VDSHDRWITTRPVDDVDGDVLQRNELVERKRVAHGRNALMAARRIRSRLRLHLVTDDPLVTVARIRRFVLAAFHFERLDHSR
jgi:hypothetical protein